jgi:hypothetical protein
VLNVVTQQVPTSPAVQNIATQVISKWFGLSGKLRGQV